LGYSFLELKNYTEAKSYMDIYFANQAVKNQDASDYINYSKICMGLGQDSLGIVYLEKAIELFPDYTEGYNEIATIYTNKAIAAKGKENEALRVKLYSKAADWYEKKMVKLGENPTDNFYLASSYFRAQNYVKADSTFRKCTDRYPESWFLIGRCEQKIDVYNSTLTGEPAKGLAKPYYEKGIILVGEHSENIEKNKKYLLEAYEVLAGIYLISEDYNCSKSACNKMLLLEPGNKKASEFLANPLNKLVLDAPGDCQLVVYPEVTKESTEGTEGN
jgi:tetratricopeptide (TPR) repeat protein